jgi:2-polyprenyl-3-methyl-5-hydroxy-6-metoxy-1,4-benzoquinol methylase
MTDEQALLDEQIRYYRARAAEYDEWFLRKGRYDRGEDHRRRWFEEVQQVRDALADSKPSGDVLEYACGTGIWTEELVKYARSITAIDAAPEAIAVNRSRLQNDKIEYVASDIFEWHPTRRYDFVFAGFWLSHVPPIRFEDFWSLVAQTLKPTGRVFIVDSSYSPESTAKDQSLNGSDHGIVRRRLNDGRRFSVVKVFYDPVELEQRLRELGWTCRIAETQEFFVYGTIQREGVFV